MREKFHSSHKNIGDCGATGALYWGPKSTHVIDQYYWVKNRLVKIEYHCLSFIDSERKKSWNVVESVGEDLYQESSHVIIVRTYDNFAIESRSSRPCQIVASTNEISQIYIYVGRVT